MENILNMMNEYSSLITIGLAVVILLLFIMILILMSSVKKLQKRYKKLMKGAKPTNLEDLINKNLSYIEKSLNNSEEALKRCEVVRDEMKRCVSKMSILRYRAFEDVGSDLSFSIAILDENNDGVLMTGIYSRHDSTTYAKPIVKGVSKYDLSEEEKHVLNEAINK